MYMDLVTARFPFENFLQYILQTYLFVWDDLICSLSFFTIQQVHTQPLITSTKSIASTTTSAASTLLDCESWEDLSFMKGVTGVMLLVTAAVVLYILDDVASLVADSELQLHR